MPTRRSAAGPATAALLVGFARGQAGFVTFFVVMLLTLPRWPAAVCWALAMFAAGALPWGWARWRQ